MSIARMVVDLRWPGPGSPGVNIWHLRTTGSGVNDPDFQGLIDIVRDFYEDGWSIVAPTDAAASFAGVLTGLADDEGDSASFTPWTRTGAQPDPTLPLMSTVVVNWLSSSGGRSGRGKNFLGPVASSVNADGVPNTAYLNDVGTAAAALIASSTGFANGAVGVWSPTDGLLRDFVGYRMSSKFGSLRSRRD